MGVHGLWKILEPTASPVKLETLRGKVLAIDASIWIYHFLKAMRDPKGTILTAAHVIGFFRRICKLLFFEIRPVFVFDGAAPVLKMQATNKRSERRLCREMNSRATANKLLTLQLQRAAANASHQTSHATFGIIKEPEVIGSVPENAVYFDELQDWSQCNASREVAAKPFVKMDQYHLPEMQSIGPLRADDQRLLTQDELDEYSKQFTSQARSGFIDTSIVDFNSKNFEKLPVETQYQLLNMARLKSRLRMGYSSEELNKMFPNEMDFSRFQINRVAQRNFFTQRLMNISGFEEDITRRISSEKGKEYLLKRTDQGWSLALEDRDKTLKSLSESQPGEKFKEQSESEAEFEDIDLSPSADLSTEQAESERAEPEKESPSLERAQTEVIDLSQEESPKLDQVFGFEAQLSRDELYNKIMNKIIEGDELEEKRRQAKPGRSVLFAESEKSRECEAPPLPNLAKDTENSSKTNPSVPWFEQENNNLEKMDINQDRDVPNFVLVDKYEQHLSDSEKELSEQEEPESDSVVLGSRNAPHKLDTTKFPTHPVNEDYVEASQISDTKDQAVKAKQSDSEMTAETSDTAQKTVEKASSTSFYDPEPSADVLLNTQDPFEQEREKEKVKKPPGVGKHVSDDISEASIECSADAAERAEKEAVEDQEEDEDIAGMLIAEAEENKRFAREIAETTNKGWTDEDQREYESQINDLRLQFSKQTRDADTVSNEMIQECQELLQLFGIPYITAPAEAEAQCAELRQLRLVDGVVTDDGDTFLFDKSAVVYRNMFNQSKFVEFYTAKQIEERLGLSRQKLIELAFLLGSDYTEGILGIGPVTGIELLAEFGDLKEFAEWWRAAQRFPDSVDVDTSLKRRLLRQFKSKLFLPEDFPSKQIIDAYMHPTVNKDSTKFYWGSPDLDGLRKFMASTAGWTLDKTNAALLPVVQEAKRQDLLRKTEKAYDQTTLDDYYKTVVQNPGLNSQRAAKAAIKMRKRAKIQ